MSESKTYTPDFDESVFTRINNYDNLVIGIVYYQRWHDVTGWIAATIAPMPNTRPEKMLLGRIITALMDINVLADYRYKIYASGSLRNLIRYVMGEYSRFDVEDRWKHFHSCPGDEGYALINACLKELFPDLLEEVRFPLSSLHTDQRKRLWYVSYTNILVTLFLFAGMVEHGLEVEYLRPFALAYMEAHKDDPVVQRFLLTEEDAKNLVMCGPYLNNQVNTDVPFADRLPSKSDYRQLVDLSDHRTFPLSLFAELVIYHNLEGDAPVEFPHFMRAVAFLVGILTSVPTLAFYRALYGAIFESENRFCIIDRSLSGKGYSVNYLSSSEAAENRLTERLGLFNPHFDSIPITGLGGEYGGSFRAAYDNLYGLLTALLHRADVGEAAKPFLLETRKVWGEEIVMRLDLTGDDMPIALRGLLDAQRDAVLAELSGRVQRTMTETLEALPERLSEISPF